MKRRLAAELGMTPSSRSRVETVRRPSGKFDELLGPLGDAYFNGRPASDKFSAAPKLWEE